MHGSSFKWKDLRIQLEQLSTTVDGSDISIGKLLIFQRRQQPMLLVSVHSLQWNE